MEEAMSLKKALNERLFLRFNSVDSKTIFSESASSI